MVSEGQIVKGAAGGIAEQAVSHASEAVEGWG